MFFRTCITRYLLGLSTLFFTPVNIGWAQLAVVMGLVMLAFKLIKRKPTNT